MKNLYNKGRRDKNEAEIREYLAARSIRNTQLMPGDGADLIVAIHPMEYWEVKDPAQPPSKRKLTDDEKELLMYCTDNHIPYVVIETVEDAEKRLDAYFDRRYEPISLTVTRSRR